MVIIGLCGYKGVGKSTVAEYLNKKYDFEITAFARPLKDIAKIFGFTNKQLYGSQNDKSEIHPELGICAREFMQKFGTEICRNQFATVFPNMKLGDSNSIWVRLMELYFEKNRGVKNICCEDVRFSDELELIQRFDNAIIIEIVRNEDFKDEYSTHISETALSESIEKFQITNNGTLRELYYKVDNLIQSIIHTNQFDNSV